MTEQEYQTRKKKKKKDILLMTGYECLDNDDRLQTIHEIRVKLKKIFKIHIGKENAITPYDLFVQLFNVNPLTMDIYKRQYWWNVVKSILRDLRSDETLFVINERNKLYVLQTSNEADYYKAKMDRDILRMQNAKKKADKWVREKRWKHI